MKQQRYKFEPEVQKTVEEAEDHSNLFISKIFLVWMIVDVLMAIIAKLFCIAVSAGLTDELASTYTQARIASVGLFSVAVLKLFLYIWTRKAKGHNHIIKYCLFAVMFISIGLAEVAYLPNQDLLFAIPLILGIFYFKPLFTVVISGISYLFFVLCRVCQFFIPTIDLAISKSATDVVVTKGMNVADAFPSFEQVDRSDYLSTMIIEMIFPSLLFFGVIGALSYLCAKRGRDILIRQNELSKATAAMEKEVEIASSIQSQMLPKEYPAFPEHKEFELYAMSIPAKSVGGDFYDYYMLDDTHLVLTIADVCGKGIPAALFMSRSMTCVESYIDKDILVNYEQIGKALTVAVNKINEALQYRNDNFTFVTAWIGVLDIATGELSCVNAGHVPPIIVGRDGQIGRLDKLSGMVFGIATNHYDVCVTKLHEGDKLFLCTDGVDEAQKTYEGDTRPQKNDMFGTERLTEYLKNNASLDCKATADELYLKIKDFTENTPQFDDITMLVFKYNGIQKS